MKKLVFITILSTFLLTGCLQVKSDVSIHENGKVDAVQYIGISEEMKQLSELSEEDSSKTMFEKMDKQELKKQGFSITSYENKDFTGVKMSKSFTNLEEMFESELFASKDNPSNPYKVERKKGLFQTVTTIKAHLPFSTIMKEEMGVEEMSEEELAMAKSMLNKMDVSFNLTTPREAISHNADKVNGTTYTWNFDMEEDEWMEIQYETMNRNNILISIGVLVLLGLFLAFVVFNKKEGDRFE